MKSKGFHSMALRLELRSPSNLPPPQCLLTRGRLGMLTGDHLLPKRGEKAALCRRERGLWRPYRDRRSGRGWTADGCTVAGNLQINK